MFPLEEVRKYREKKKGNMSNTVTLSDCFKFKQQNEYFKIFCNICKKQSDFVYNTKIYKSPNVLIIVLNR